MKASRTRKANREALKEHATGERFEIELTPPPPFRPASEEVKKFHAKLEATLERVPHGAAFIIPAKTKNSALKYLRENHAKDTFRFFTIEDNKEFLRVYRVKKDKH